MAANGISTLSTKQARQVAKLNLAQSNKMIDKKSADVLDLSRLPTQYTNNVVSDNANIGGLIAGRPWTSVLALFANNEVGLWYDPSDVANLDWRRNLLTYSEQFDNAVWTKNNTTINANTTTAPDGSLTSDKMSETAVTAEFQVRVSGPSVTSFTFSTYAKAAERDKVYLQFVATSNEYVFFDLTNGTVAGSQLTITSNTASRSSSITAVGGGWYRCSITITLNSAAALSLRVGVSDTIVSSVPNYTGVLGSGIFLWGAQLELGSTASEYQKITDINTEINNLFPKNTLFQDAAGTTPVTTVGQPVGLHLDKSKGLLLGPELVTNGDFSAGATGWTLGAGWAISGGLLNGATGAFSEAWTGFTTTTGKTYRVTITISVTAGSVLLYLSNGNNVAINSSGTFTLHLVAGASGNRVSLGGQNFTGSIDNISVRELAGIHRTQSISLSRPTFSTLPITGRRNLFVETEFRNGVTDAAVRGGLISATTLTGYAGALVFGRDGVTTTYAYKQLAVTTGVTYTMSAIVEMTDGLGPPVFSGTAATNDFALIMESNAQSAANHVTTALGGGLYRVSASKVSATTGTTNFGVVKNAAYSARTFKVTAYQMQVGVLTAYQRVVSNYDITEAGVKNIYGLYYDGIDDFMVTPTITPNTDKVQVFAGVRKNSDAAAGTVIELSDTADSNNGTLFLRAPQGAAANYIFRSRGTVVSNVISPSSYAAPITNVVTGLGDIAGVVSRIRVNGSQVAESLTDQGTGNYLAYPIYFGRRGGSTLPFNGYMFGEIIRFGSNLDDNTITAIETWINQKTKAY